MNLETKATSTGMNSTLVNKEASLLPNYCESWATNLRHQLLRADSEKFSAFLQRGNLSGICPRFMYQNPLKTT
jgi:hypothetical protein